MSNNYVIIDSLNVNKIYTQTIISEYIDRFASDILTRSEQKILRFIFDRTINWNKLSEQIPMRHFVNGFSSGNNIICKGVGYCSETIRNALKGLISKGLVIRTLKDKISSCQDQVPEYQINFNHEFFYYLKMSEGSIKIKVPKHLQNKDLDTTQKIGGDSPKNSEEHYNTDKGNPEKKAESKFQHNNDDDKDKIKNLLENIKAKTIVKKENKIASIKTNDKVSVIDFVNMWTHYVKSSDYAYKDVIITGKEKGQIKHLLSVLREQLSTFKKGEKTDGVLISDFIEFTIKNWSSITNKQFKNLREKTPDRFPNNPSLQFLLAFYKVFVNYCWNYKNGITIQEEELELTDYQKEVMRLVRSGISIENARRDADFKFNRTISSKINQLDSTKQKLDQEKEKVSTMKKELNDELSEVKKGSYLIEKEKVLKESLERMKALEITLRNKEQELKLRETSLESKEKNLMCGVLENETDPEILSMIEGILKFVDLSYIPERAIGEDNESYKSRLKDTYETIQQLYG